MELSLRQVCKVDTHTHTHGLSLSFQETWQQSIVTLKCEQTSSFYCVLVENVDQFVLAAGLPTAGVVGSIVFQEGKIDALVIHNGQRLDMRQELLGHLELEGTYPVGTKLDSALHTHEALVLNVHRRCTVETRTL